MKKIESNKKTAIKVFKCKVTSNKGNTVCVCVCVSRALGRVYWLRAEAARDARVFVFSPPD